MASDTIEELEAQMLDMRDPLLLTNQRHLQQQKKIIKSLNMVPAYTSHINDGNLQELVQNWQDQCRVATTEDSMIKVLTVSDFQMMALKADSGRLKFFGVVGEVDGELKSLGYLAEYSDAKGNRALQLKNFGAQVSLEQMTLGLTTKAADSRLAGPHCIT